MIENLNINVTDEYKNVATGMFLATAWIFAFILTILVMQHQITLI